MDVMESNERAASLTLALLRKHFPKREGFHVSDMTDVCTRKAYFRAKEPEVYTPDLIMAFIRGSILHELLATADAEVEIELEGVVGHVDQVEGSELVERKTTNLSSNNPKFPPHWLRRMMAYCRMAGRQRHWLDVMHLQGDYRPPRLPTLRCYCFTFTPEEVATNWSWVMERKGMLEGALKTGEAPPVSSRLGVLGDDKDKFWDCRECAFLTRCLAELTAEGMKEGK